MTPAAEHSPQAPLTALAARVRAGSEGALDAFIDLCASRGLQLYGHQEEAFLEIFDGKNVVLNTPTGSGKSLVALAMHFKAMVEGKRSYYTAPIKALVSEKFFALCREFGADNVGMMTGDATVNRTAPIICCTAEILAQVALSEGDRADVAYAIVDEFHYYSDRDRGAAWQIPLLALPQTTFLLMSATMGNVGFFTDELTRRTGRPSALVQSSERPVPLDFSYQEIPLHETIAQLVEQQRSPVYLVNFSQREAIEEAQNLMSVNFLSKEQKAKIHDEIGAFRFDSPFGKDMSRFLRHGLGVHHAGLLPKYRLLTERLAQRGLLAIISGTDTLGVGVNVPIRTVLFTKLCKYDGDKTAILSVRDFHQIAGRAGRKGFDDRGFVVAMAPEHVIENKKIDEKLAANPNKKLVKKKPPDFGYVAWDAKTFQRLQDASPEPLQSQFEVTHTMVLEVVQSPGGYARLLRLIDQAHGRGNASQDERTRRDNRRRAATLFRSLRSTGVIEVLPRGSAQRIVVHDDLQGDFSLTHALGLWLVNTVPMLDPGEADYVLDVLSLCEAVVENPRPVLDKQLDKLKTDKMNQMKAEGVPYEERIATLQQMEWPKPKAELIYQSFNHFAEKHPWLQHNTIRPKSVAREMVERFMGFNDYVREYGLQRSEGVLLRYLSDVYKTLAKSVPQAAKTEELYDLQEFLLSGLRQVDSSLIEEWERLQAPAPAAAPAPASPFAPPPHKQDSKLIERRARAELHRLLRALSTKAWDDASSAIAPDESWTPERFDKAMAPFFAEHPVLLTTPIARGTSMTLFDKASDVWRLTQILCDGEGDNDWYIAAELDTASTLPSDRPAIRLLDIRR